MNQTTSFLILVFYMLGLVSAQESSCNEYVSIQKFRGESYALVTIFEPDRKETEVIVIVTLASRGYKPAKAGLSLAKSDVESQRDVASGRPLLLNLEFPVQNPLPKISEIYVNGHLICANARDSQNFVAAAISYFITFTSNLPDVGGPTRPAAFLTRAPTTSRAPPLVTRRPTTPATRRPTTTTQETSYYGVGSSELDQVCGVSDIKKPVVGGLIFGGKAVVRGEFPWLAAYFYTEQANTQFICGGSLISTRLVVTAAHCIESPGAYSTRRKAEFSLFYIGKNDLEALISERNYVSSQAEQLHLHPSWNKGPKEYDNDIAIAVLIRKIEFNKYVKPVCIWRETYSYDDIINKQGKVAGWGKTDPSAITAATTAKYVLIPAVSNEQCLKSNIQFHSLLGDVSFCGGYLDQNRGPCNGDSGGSFIIEHNGKAYLRGIVSAALLDSDGICDVNKYVVFTDVPKFTDWIDEFLNSYG